jgi:hypothetical protein
LNTRFSRCAQVIAMDGMYAGFAGAKTGHRRMMLNWRLLLLAIRCYGLAAFSPLRRCHQRTVFAMRGKYTMESCQIDSGPGHQCGKPGNEIHRLEDDACGAIPVGGFQLAPDLAMVRQ